MSKIAKIINANFDLRDAVLLVALVLIGIGLSMIYLPIALVVPGVVLLYVALFHGSSTSKVVASNPDQGILAPGEDE